MTATSDEDYEMPLELPEKPSLCYRVYRAVAKDMRKCRGAGMVASPSVSEINAYVDQMSASELLALISDALDENP